MPAKKKRFTFSMMLVLQQLDHKKSDWTQVAGVRSERANRPRTFLRNTDAVNNNTNNNGHLLRPLSGEPGALTMQIKHTTAHTNALSLTHTHTHTAIENTYKPVRFIQQSLFALHQSKFTTSAVREFVDLMENPANTLRNRLRTLWILHKEACVL